MLTCPTMGLAQAAQCPFGMVIIPCLLISVFRFPSIVSRWLSCVCAPAAGGTVPSTLAPICHNQDEDSSLFQV